VPEEVWNLKTITILYVLNATLLLLHEIESAYEKEWEILKLPGKITGFLLLHIPIILLILYGLIEIEKLSIEGVWMGVVFGIGGIVPFLVHKVFVHIKDRFSSVISNLIIYSNALSGALLVYLSIDYLF